MPLYAPTRNPKLYLPTTASIQKWNPEDTVSANSSKTNSFDQPFEPGQLVKWNNGSTGINFPAILSEGFKYPAYAAEAPLRPLFAATGDTGNAVLKWVGDHTGIGWVVNALQGGLKASSDAGGAVINQRLASQLKWAIGKPDNTVWNGFDPQTLFAKPGSEADIGKLTAGEIRKRALAQWQYDPTTQQPLTLQDLEARAQNNVWDFGSLPTNPNQTMDFVNRMIADPINAVFFAGPAIKGAQYALEGASAAADAFKASTFAERLTQYGKLVAQQAEWARPVIKPIKMASDTTQFGYGYMKALGRGIAETSRTGGIIAKFPDVYTSAVQLLEGSVENATLRSFVQAGDWTLRGIANVGRKVYFPGFDGTSGKFLGSAAKAWMRGGIQQEAVTIGGELATGGIQNLLFGDQASPVIQDGWTAKIHDILQGLNNSHPLSSSDAFVLATMATPWGELARDIIKTPWRLRTMQVNKHYEEQVLREFIDQTIKRGGPRMTYDEALSWLGNGDPVKGKEIFTQNMWEAEALKVQNQFSDFTMRVSEIDDLARRRALLEQQMFDNITSRRRSGALQPRSTAEYMMQQMEQMPTGPLGQDAPVSLTLTPEIIRDAMTRNHNFAQQLGPQLKQLYGLQKAQSSVVTKEEISAIINMVKGSPKGAISRELAGKVIDQGRALIYQDELFQSLAVNLGQKIADGKFGRAAALGEGTTRQELLDALDKAYQDAPSSADMFHEVTQAAQAVRDPNTAAMGVSDPPYDLNRKLKSNRDVSAGRVRQLLSNQSQLENMRSAEFFKNGKPRLGSAKQIVGSDGGIFQKAGDGSYVRKSDGMTISVAGENAQIKVGTPGFPYSIDREALITAVQGGGRTMIMPSAEGEFMASLGFKEVARLKDSNLAAYAYRGGDPLQLRANAAMGVLEKYKPSKLVVAREAKALRLAADSARKASLFMPANEALGPSPSSDGLRSMNPEARLQHIQEHLDATRAAYADEVKRISMIDETAAKAGFIPVDAPALSDWMQAANKTQIDRYLEVRQQMNADYPSLTLEPGVKMLPDPTDSRIQMLSDQRSLYRRMAFDYGYLNPIARVYDALLTPINSKFLLKTFKQEMWNQMGSLGANADQIEKFVGALRQDLEKWHPTGGPSGFLGVRWIRSVHALPEGHLRAAGIQAFGDTINSRILEKYGEYQKMLTESGNRLLRSSVQTSRYGKSVNPLQAAIDGAFRIYQYGTGPVSGYTRAISKLWYPILRFSTDPFWLLFNSVESDLLGLGMEGAKGTRFAPVKVDLAQERRAQQLASTTVVPPGGLPAPREGMAAPAGALQQEMVMWDYGFYMHSRAIQPVIDRNFAIKRLNSTEDFFRAMPKEHPIAQMMTERFGNNYADWAAEADKILYGWTNEGPVNFVKTQFNEELKKLGYTPEQLKQIIPMVERLTEMHRGVYSDLTNILVGRMNRSNLERVLDHIMVFWPMSYQIKAATWLWNTLMSRYGTFGAYAYTQIRNKALNDQPLQDWLGQNQDAAFMMDMLFPITPESIGVSLSRPVRYVGSWFNPKAFGTYQNNPTGNPLSVMYKTFADLGIERTLKWTSGVWNKNASGFVQDQLGIPFDPSMVGKQTKQHIIKAPWNK